MHLLRNNLIRLALCCVALGGSILVAQARSAYAPINGLQLFYSTQGDGPPLILLHGGVTADEVFGTNTGELAKTRKVVIVHLQGHGHTKDIDRPLRFESLADDVAALMAT